VFTLDPAYFSEEVLSHCLTFLYVGVVQLDKDSPHLAETITAANLFNLPELATIGDNAQKGEEFLNPSIGTWLNDRNSEVAKELFLNKVRCGYKKKLTSVVVGIYCCVGFVQFAV